MLWRHFSAEEPWVLERIRIPSDTCGRGNSIWIRYVWTGKFLNPERKSCGFKNIRMRVDRALDVNRRGSPSSENAEFGHLTLFFKGLRRNAAEPLHCSLYLLFTDIPVIFMLYLKPRPNNYIVWHIMLRAFCYPVTIQSVATCWVLLTDIWKWWNFVRMRTSSIFGNQHVATSLNRVVKRT